MKSSSVLGLASTLVRGKKYKLAMAGIQFAYLGYIYYKKKKKEKRLAVAARQQ